MVAEDAPVERNACRGCQAGGVGGRTRRGVERHLVESGRYLERVVA